MIKIHPSDNVAVMEDGHKTAICNIKSGDNIIKYGYSIGIASCDIKIGETVHSHNLKTGLNGISDYAYTPELSDMKYKGTAIFNGYQRENGTVGIRNEIWIINTVGCVNKTCEHLALLANQQYSGMCDGFYTFSHPYGCSQLGGDHSTTQKILSGLIKNPNAAGVLVVGLGCENNNIPAFKKILGEINIHRVKFMITQETDDEIETGLKLLKDLAEYASKFTRSECSISKLAIGLKCGGSDAFSGITANPTVGSFSDLIISMGGSTVLTEVPEMFGAETILMNRCINETVFNKTVSLINKFKEYFISYNQPIYENPSPGNKAGGITTLEEKSLGCVQKGGTANVVDVIGMGEAIKTNGLTLLDGPGNDIVASTNLAASGCQLILFTTGRGTPLGAPVPTVKISSNNNLAQKKPHWIDFNAAVDGDILDKGKLLLDFVLDVVNGKLCNNEINGYREIAIFKNGVTL